jgi:HK97 family phage prohead protease
MTDDTLIREFPVQLKEGDGRTIDLRVVPYNTIARVADPPHYNPYDEMWMRGAFDKQLTAASRIEVFLNFEHQQGLQGIIGHGVTLIDTEDGLEGTFRVHDNADGDKALSLVKEGLLRGVSLEAKPMGKSPRVNGVVQRHRAHLDKVSLVRTGRPAYKDAAVLAVRTQPPEPVPVFDPDLAERLAKVGIVVPERLTP